MPTLLAIDASTETCSVALLHQHQRWESICPQPRVHAAELLPRVDALLQQAGVSLHQLQAIAYGAGPGSFTGIRIALGFAQGLALGLSIPLIPIQSLEAMALHYSQTHSHPLPLITCLLDARMDECYLGCFSYEQGLLQPLQPAMLCAREAVLSHLPQSPNATMAGLGDGWGQLPPEHQALLGFCNLQAVPLASAGLALAAKAFTAGQWEAPETAEPLYLRHSVSWNKRQRLRLTPLV